MGLSEAVVAVRWTMVLKITAAILAVGVACLAFYKASFYGFEFPSALSLQSSPDSGISRVLRRASMQNNTVILTTVNDAWMATNSTFDLFVESFRIGNNTSWLLKHLVVIALDQQSYKRCMELQHHCFFLKTRGKDFSHEAYFMTSAYLEMMWRRIDFLHTVLHLGYNFIFTDADIMWFRDPFPHFYSKTDFQIACDQFNGNSWDINNAPNGGFNYVKSNNRTIEFYKFWYNSRTKYPGMHDQDVLNRIKYDPFMRNIGLKLRFLDTLYFGGFCQPSKNFNKVCTMHANCCKGLVNKVYDLNIVLEDWRRYMLLPPTEKALNPLHWRVPHKCYI